MAASVPTGYQKAFTAFETKLHAGKETPCSLLLHLRALSVELAQTKNTYWRRPCLRDWPCIWDQHRSEMDKLMERLAPIEKDLERQCKSQTAVEEVAKAAAIVRTNNTATSTSMSAKEINNNNFNVSHLDKV